MSIVRISGLKKAFGETRVLRSLDLEVEAGERVAIIGRSGSGKSTLLRILMTLEQPDAGRVEVLGRPLWPAESEEAQRLARRHLGMVFQQFNLFPHLTVQKNVTLALEKVWDFSPRAAFDRASELLEQVGLADKAEAYPSELSGGQQQRVAIARALAPRPEVMLFDEITSALDPELVGEVLEVLLSLAAKRETAMLVVTHEMRFARDVADRVLFFDAGEIVEDGPPDRVLRAPRDPRTAQFLESVVES
jgi:polar amino acid transport system ATP-binding protein